MQVQLSASARNDLTEIGAFIAEDNPVRAESFVSELLERCQGLAAHAQRYPVVVEIKGVALRRCPFGRYLIFYAATDDGVEIAHIFHSARDYMRLLYPDD